MENIADTARWSVSTRNAILVYSDEIAAALARDNPSDREVIVRRLEKAQAVLTTADFRRWLAGGFGVTVAYSDDPVVIAETLIYEARRGRPSLQTTTMAVVETPLPPAAPDQPTYEATRLLIPEDFSFDRWQALGETLQLMERSVLWWIGDWWNYGEFKYGEMASQAAKDAVQDQTGYTYDTVRNAAYVASRFEFERRRSNLPWSSHQEVAPLPRDEADQWLNLAEANHWAQKSLRAELRGARQAALVERLVAAPTPTGVFNVLYADPPWEYDATSVDPSRRIENHYPTMSVDALAMMKIGDRLVGEYAARDALIFLWAPAPKLLDAMAVMGAWAFDYRTCLVWVKDQIGMGHYVRQRHELLLIGRRGDFPTPAPADRPESVFNHPRLEHSRKPDLVYALIERMYPGASRLELFARRERPGWTQYGNEPALGAGL